MIKLWKRMPKSLSFLVSSIPLRIFEQHVIAHASTSPCLICPIWLSVSVGRRAQQPAKSGSAQPIRRLYSVSHSDLGLQKLVQLLDTSMARQDSFDLHIILKLLFTDFSCFWDTNCHCSLSIAGRYRVVLDSE